MSKLFSVYSQGSEYWFPESQVLWVKDGKSLRTTGGQDFEGSVSYEELQSVTAGQFVTIGVSIYDDKEELLFEVLIANATHANMRCQLWKSDGVEIQQFLSIGQPTGDSGFVQHVGVFDTKARRLHTADDGYYAGGESLREVCYEVVRDYASSRGKAGLEIKCTNPNMFMLQTLQPATPTEATG